MQSSVPASPLAPPPSPVSASAVPAPSPTATPPAAELQRELAGLESRVRRGQRNGWLLTGGAVAALCCGFVCWVIYYAATVLPYARVSDVQLFRLPGDGQRLALVFQPSTGGLVGFGRADAERQTQLLDRVARENVGQQQEFIWRVSGVRTGDLVAVTYLDGWRLKTVELPVPDAPGVASTAAGSKAAAGGQQLSGQIISATDKTPVVGAKVRVLGTRLETQTDASGRFELTGAPAGAVSLAVAAEGFATETIERRAARSDAPVRVAMNPGMEQGQIRIVLTWGAAAQDLDAHLEGPLPDGERFHVYYHQQGDLKSREFVRLDVDDQANGGPETITVLGVLPGTYRYWVHDYSNRERPEVNDLSRADAEVRVYQGGQTYRFRAGHETPGNVWDVCTIEVTPQGAVVRKVDKYQGVKVETLGLYAKRTMARREEWIGAYGGTPETEKAVKAALEWLARHQLTEGAWSNRGLEKGSETRCEASDPCSRPGRPHDMAHTGLALLAFQAGGHYHFNGAAHSATVKQGLDWLVSHQRPDGALVDAHPKDGHAQYFMYQHGIAAFALADACAAAVANQQSVDPRYLNALKRAVDFIERVQHADGGWRYKLEKNEVSDMSVSGWPVLALKSAKEAGLEISPRVVTRAQRLFEKRLMNDRGRSRYDDLKQVSEATTAVGMLGRQFLFGEPDAPVVHEAAEHLADFAELHKGLDEQNRPNYYTWYNGSLAMFMHGGKPWQRWNAVVRDKILSLQRQTGCERGSWDPTDRWSDQGGRIYSTALAALSLEVYYRYTSESERGGEFEMHGAAPAGGEIVAPEMPPVELPGRGDALDAAGDDEGAEADAATGVAGRARGIKKKPAAEKRRAVTNKNVKKPRPDRPVAEMHGRGENGG